MAEDTEGSFSADGSSFAEGSMPLEGRAAPPMANGEVIFEAPWQGRAFGLARVLCEAGHYSWDEFREHLIANIAHWESDNQGEPYQYFDCFLSALMELLDQTGLCQSEALGVREAEFTARPHDH